MNTKEQLCSYVDLFTVCRPQSEPRTQYLNGLIDFAIQKELAYSVYSLLCATLFAVFREGREQATSHEHTVQAAGRGDGTG